MIYEVTISGLKAIQVDTFKGSYQLGQRCAKLNFVLAHGRAPVWALGTILVRDEMTLKAAAVMALLVLVGCSSPAPPVRDASAQSLGFSVRGLAGGRLDALPTGGVFVRVIQFPQAEGYTIFSKQHVPGFVFVESGAHVLTLLGQPAIDLAAGQATFHGNISHTHFNPGPGQSVWYFIAVWPSSAHQQGLVDPIAKPEFQSADFSPEQLPSGLYSQVLRHVTLADGGRSQAHRFGGLALFFVLEGSIEIRTAQGILDLRADEGAAYVPETPLQEVNRTQGRAVYLEMLTTASEREFEVPLMHAPSG